MKGTVPMKPIKYLRFRLTCLYTITTGTILTLALSCFLLLSMEEARQDRLDRFYATWNSLTYHLASDSMVSQSYLAQTEVYSRSVIHIEENGVPLFFQGSWFPATSRQNLIVKAKEQAGAQGVFTSTAPVSSSSSSTTLLTINGENQDQYYAMILVLPYKKSLRSLCLISYRPPVLQTLKKTLFILLAAGFLSILCLLFFSWHFVGWSLRPVEESQRKQAEFIAAASHELRSPLAVLRSGAAAILSSPDKRELLQKTMDSECARMSRLIDDMLLLASADAKTWEVRFQKTDMDTLLIETYEAFLPACAEKQICLELDLPEYPLPSILADPHRIRQILSVLLDNAVSYTPAGRKIQIRAFARRESKGHRYFPRSKSASGQLVLQVADQGRGIPDDQKSRIFDRFYRVDKARCDKTHFGLGLSIARELAALHKGTVTVEDNPGGGSCFLVILPVCVN